MQVGQSPPGQEMTLAHLPLTILLTAVMAGLFSLAFKLGMLPPAVSLLLLAFMMISAGMAARGAQMLARSGTRLQLAQIALVCLIGGLAVSPPEAHSEMLRWGVAVIAAAAIALGHVEDWLAGKIDAAGPFSRQLGREANAVLVLALAVLLWRGGVLGNWVLAVGVLRYILLVAGGFTPALRLAGPAWRRAVALAVPACLAAALVPGLPAFAASALGILALWGVLGGAIFDLASAQNQADQ